MVLYVSVKCTYVQRWEIMNWKKWERNRSWPSLRQSSAICLNALHKNKFPGKRVGVLSEIRNQRLSNISQKCYLLSLLVRLHFLSFRYIFAAMFTLPSAFLQQDHPEISLIPACFGVLSLILRTNIKYINTKIKNLICMTYEFYSLSVTKLKQ